MRYLVTGGAGFIGGHLVERLVADGDEVVAIDDCSSGNDTHLISHIEGGKVPLYRRSILDDLADIFTEHRFDGVFHLAAMPQVQYSISHPSETHAANVTGTLALLEMARLQGVKRFVFASSAAVYGDDAVAPCDENSPLNPLSPYALHKQIGEQYLSLYHRVYGLETIALRFFNVFGPRQNPSGAYASLIPKTLARIAVGEAPRIYGDGEQTRDFVYVGDVTAAMMAAMRTENQEVLGQVCNVGSGRAVTVNTIVAELIRQTGSSLSAVYAEPVIEPRDSCADISRIKRLLGWTPHVSLTEGLTAIISPN